MSSRPTSVTVIAWILIGMNVLGLFGLAVATIRHSPAANELMAKSPVPIPIQHAMGEGGMVVGALCGYFLLQGKNSARYLYVTWTTIHSLFSLVTLPFKLVIVPGAAIFLLITYFLFRPQANAFFAGGGANVCAK